VEKILYICHCVIYNLDQMKKLPPQGYIGAMHSQVKKL